MWKRLERLGGNKMDDNIPQKIKVYQEVFEWDILEHYYKRSNGDDLLELCTIFNTGELLS